MSRRQKQALGYELKVPRTCTSSSDGRGNMGNPAGQGQGKYRFLAEKMELLKKIITEAASKHAKASSSEPESKHAKASSSESESEVVIVLSSAWRRRDSLRKEAAE